MPPNLNACFFLHHDIHGTFVPMIFSHASFSHTDVTNSSTTNRETRVVQVAASERKKTLSSDHRSSASLSTRPISFLVGPFHGSSDKLLESASRLILANLKPSGVIYSIILTRNITRVRPIKPKPTTYLRTAEPPPYTSSASTSLSLPYPGEI